MRARHARGQSSFGLEVGRFLFSEVLSKSSKSKWRIGNDIHNCKLCGKCQMICPTNAITVSTEEKTWTLNNMRCRQCLECLMKCPSRCLTQVRL